jgi:hypothetical protein
MMQRGVKLQIQINHGLEEKDEKILGCELGTQVGTSDGKNRRSKIWHFCPFTQYVKSWYSGILVFEERRIFHRFIVHFYIFKNCFTPHLRQLN